MAGRDAGALSSALHLDFALSGGLRGGGRAEARRREGGGGSVKITL